MQRSVLAALVAVVLAPIKPAETDLFVQSAFAQQSETISADSDFFRDRLENGGLSPEMVALPAGSFLMGSTPSEVGYVKNEGPQYEVAINAFSMSKYEVTEAQFSEFLRATGAVRQGACDVYLNGTWTRKKPAETMDWLSSVDEPAICVTWEQAAEFASWMSDQTGFAYRLPSEEEWEYAARSAAQTAFSFGDDAEDGCKHMNGADRSAEQLYPKLIGVRCDDGFAQLAPVGSLKPNAFGLHDMHGNVWEWTGDAWTDSHAPGELQDEARVIKGGSWFSYPMWLRSANRNAWQPDRGRADVGFRIVRDLAPDE